MNKDFLILDILNGVKGDISSLKLPDPGLYDYYLRLSNRELWWNDIVDDNLVEMGYQIMKWNREDKGIPVNERKPIKIFINSDGGSVTAVMNFVDVVELSRTPVYTIGLGKCYSSGGIMLMAGHKGKRLIMKSATALIHDGSNGFGGNTSKLGDYADFSKGMDSVIEKWILTKTNITKELYKENWRKDWWFFADDIIKYSLADKVITDIDEIL